MVQKIYSGSLNLTKLQCVRMKTKKGTEGLFIPIKENHFIEGKEKEGVVPVYMNVLIIVKDEADQYGQHGFIAQKLGTEEWKALPKEKQKEVQDSLPILGNIKDFSGGNADEASGVKSTKTFDPQDDDLPF